MKTTTKIPVHIITGFLGSGKTTVLIDLMKRKNNQELWAVVINDFGKVSIDYETLGPRAGENEKVYDVSGGCICCSAREYFEQNLKEIISSNKFDRILIEPSGLGGAEMITTIIENIPELDLMPVVCLIAVQAIGDPRFDKIPLFRRQILSSDLLLISQCDLLDSKQELESKIKEVQKEYPGKLDYLTSFNGEIERGTVLNGEKTKLNPLEKLAMDTVDLSDQSYVSESRIWQKEKVFDEVRLKNTLTRIGVYRAKGFLNTAEGWKFVSCTVSNYYSRICEPQKENTFVVICDRDGEASGIDICAELNGL